MKRIIWEIPIHLNRYRVFPRLFIGIYLYILVVTVHWFMTITDPNTQQAGFISTIVGVGAAWFGLYTNSGNISHSLPAETTDITDK